MEKLYSSKELAKALGVRQSVVLRKLRHEGWPHVKKIVKWGIIYCFRPSDLPLEIQIKLLHGPPIPFGLLAESGLTRAKAKSYLFALALKYTGDHQLLKVAGLNAFCQQYNDKTLAVDPILYVTIPTLSTITLLRWEKKRQGIEVFNLMSVPRQLR